MTNRTIEALTDGPCTNDELPYRAGWGMSLSNRMRLRRIHVTGKRTNSGNNRVGAFKTIYYLEGDEDRAVTKFIDVNIKPLLTLNYRHNNALDAGLTRDMAQRIRAEMGKEQ